MEVLESPQVVEAQGLRTGPVSGAMTSPIISGEQQIFEKIGIVFLLARKNYMVLSINKSGIVE
jgi:hypothetical protein